MEWNKGKTNTAHSAKEDKGGKVISLNVESESVNEFVITKTNFLKKHHQEHHQEGHYCIVGKL